MGLLADLWTRFKALLPDWLLYFLGLIIDFIDNLVLKLDEGIGALQSAWSNFTTKTLPELWKAIEEGSVTIVQNIENMANYTVETMENTYNYITQEIHNTYHTTKQYITQVIGATEEYVDNAVAGVDTVGFFKDPLGYIQTAFNGFIEYWIHGAMKSFQEGLEEGLREPQE